MYTFSERIQSLKLTESFKCLQYVVSYMVTSNIRDNAPDAVYVKMELLAEQKIEELMIEMEKNFLTKSEQMTIINNTLETYY